MARTVPSPTYEAPGVLVTAGLWNSGPKGLNDFLGNRPAFRGRNNGNQSVANNTWTAISWLLNMLDTDSGHSIATNNSRYTCQVAGWYWCKANISWNYTGTNPAARIDTGIAKNGGIWVGSSQFLTKGANVLSSQQASALVQLNVGDWVELWVRQETGNTISIDFGFGIECGFDVLWVHS